MGGRSHSRGRRHIRARVRACGAQWRSGNDYFRSIPACAQLNTIEYAQGVLRKEPEALILAYNEPALAGCAPERTVVRFDWTTPLPRCWNWPLWISRFERARYLFPSESERQIFLEHHARIPSRQAVVVRNAVDLELFTPAEGNAAGRPG